MTIFDMLGQSGVLTLLGMGIVFSFLVILIVAVTLAGKAVHALGWDRDVRAPAAAAKPASRTADQAAVTAAVSAAVTEYRKNNP
jgi:oxaloacetate decarboxylase gamma subunit